MAVATRVSPRFPGLTLKAWAHVNTGVANGASVIISSYGLASGVRSGVGSGTFTFSSNMTTANYAVHADALVSVGSAAVTIGTRAVGSCTFGENANRDWIGWIGFYE